MIPTKTVRSLSALVAFLIIAPFSSQSFAVEKKSSGMKDIEVRCEQYFKDEKASKKCMREERRAAMDIFELSEELKDEGKSMRTAPSSQEYDNEAVQRGKYFGACATLFHLHKDRMACYHEGVEKYQERINARLAGKDPFSQE